MNMRDAVVAVVGRGDRFLMIRRAEGIAAAGFWIPPSGRVEPDESFEHAVEREMLEELGLRVLPVRKVWQCPTEDESMMLHWWEAQAVGDITTVDRSEIAEYRWCSVADIEGLSPTFEDDVRFFTEVWPALDPS